MSPFELWSYLSLAIFSHSEKLVDETFSNDPPCLYGIAFSTRFAEKPQIRLKLKKELVFETN